MTVTLPSVTTAEVELHRLKARDINEDLLDKGLRGNLSLSNRSTDSVLSEVDVGGFIGPLLLICTHC